MSNSNKKYNKQSYIAKDARNIVSQLSRNPKGRREFLYFLSMLKQPFGLWVKLPTKETLVELRYFLRKSNIDYDSINMKHQFGKNLSLLYKLSWLNSEYSKKGLCKRTLFNFFSQGGTIFFAFADLPSFTKALSFFFKDKAFEKFNSNFLSKFNLMSGAIVLTKFFSFLIPSNLGFFSFFINSMMLMKTNLLHFNLIFIKTTMVVLYSIMLIILFFKMIFLRFMSINTRLFFSFAFYANKESIS